MSLAPLRRTTALVASLALVLPPPGIVSPAWAEEAEQLCRDGSAPPCPEGEPADGASAEEHAEAEAREAEDAAAEAQAEADRMAAEAEAAAEEARRLEEEAAEAERAAADAAQAEALAAEAAAEAARLEALAATAEAVAQAAEEAAAAEAEAQAAEEAAAAEAEAQAAEEAVAAEAEAQAAEEAAEAAAQAAEEAAAEDAAAAGQTLIDPTVDEEAEPPLAAVPEATPSDVLEETLGAGSVRSSAEEFDTSVDGQGQPAADGQSRGRSGLSNIETALLLGLGAVAVGAVLRNGDRVVANTGDRVVVQGSQGLAVYRNDDALLAQPGAVARTETFSDGSSRTVIDRPDGSRLVTTLDARGRVLRRAAVFPDGSEVALFDDVAPTPAVDMRGFEAARPTSPGTLASQSDLTALRAALRQGPVVDPGRSFSLRQIREIAQVRSLVPAIEVDTVRFATGSAAVPADQARGLLRLGIAIEEILFENPGEVFLIEGHTDAVGSDSVNLALSDRRAESVALVLTEEFNIPPENLVIQGYGAQVLRVATQAAEERNRRTTVRRITPLLRPVQN